MARRQVIEKSFVRVGAERPDRQVPLRKTKESYVSLYVYCIDCIISRIPH